MTRAPASLLALAETLESADPALPVRFHVQGAALGDGYHITELKLADIESIDCGGRRNAWREALVQVLDGQDGEALVAGKVASILRKGLAAIPGLADVPFAVECAPGNLGLSRFAPGRPETAGGQIVIPLENERALCKPAIESGCCAPTNACCA
ncbi:DUF6428 family protein [Pseudoruegeria sp. HB172150]|uniref:DUF6428 family protein n=1 Tax=Pseudoruegeria sp. HB172150 TaxID=2721164 RepID=UPI00155211C2|nr:DUF6428 family protein [Pseudoruegeria sp. HB172150]